MTILFQGWQHDGTAERECSDKCGTCNLTAQVQAEINYRVAAERERCIKIVMDEERNGHWSSQHLLRKSLAREIREGK